MSGRIVALFRNEATSGIRWLLIRILPEMQGLSTHEQVCAAERIACGSGVRSGSIFLGVLTFGGLASLTNTLWEVLWPAQRAETATMAISIAMAAFGVLVAVSQQIGKTRFAVAVRRWWEGFVARRIQRVQSFSLKLGLTGGLVVVLGLAGLITGIVLHYASNAGPSSRAAQVLLALGLSVFWALCFFAAHRTMVVLRALVNRKRFRRDLRRQLLGHGVLTCHQCGYDLRGSASARCSECGTPLPLWLYAVTVRGRDVLGPFTRTVRVHWINSSQAAALAVSAAQQVSAVPLEFVACCEIAERTADLPIGVVDVGLPQRDPPPDAASPDRT